MPRKYVRKTTRPPNAHHKAVRPPAVFKPGFLATIDGRTELARTLRARRDEIIADIGGLTELSRVKAVLIDRYVWLECIAQTLEEQMAAGNGDAAGRYAQLVNAISGLAVKLGLDRRQQAMPWLTATEPEPAEPEPAR